MIIDFHTHIYPDHLAQRVISNANAVDVDNYSDGTARALRRSMTEAGVSHAVLLNIATKPGQTKRVVEYAADIKKREEASGHGQTLIPLASLHPFEDNWKYWLRRIKKLGFPGIKLHPEYQNFYVDDPKLEPLYREVADLGLLLVIHAGIDLSKPELCHGTPRRFANILPLLEKCTTVLAHMGGLGMPLEAYDLLCGKDIYLDTSYDFHRLDRELARNMVRKHSPDRILFGSDSPWCSQKLLVDYLRNDFAPGFLSDEHMENILWGNGTYLLGLHHCPQ